MVMHAIQLVDGELHWTATAKPEVGPGQVLIRNLATAINRADLAQRAGNYPPPPGASDILGLECAGIVDAIGEDVLSYKVGDSVCALLAGGGHAEYVAVPAAQVLRKPSNLSYEEAAALPEVFATAYLNVFIEAHAEPDEIVLVHAGASGVGTAAIQMCKAFENPCFVTAGSDAKVEYCKNLGATDGLNRHTSAFENHVQEWTGDHGMDVILDPVGGSYLAANLQSLAVDGRLILIGLLSGAQAAINLAQLMTKRARIVGSTLRARSIAAKGRVIAQLRDRVWPLIEQERIKPIVETVFPIAHVQQAHALLATNATIGKIVLRIPH